MQALYSYTGMCVQFGRHRYCCRVLTPEKTVMFNVLKVSAAEKDSKKTKSADTNSLIDCLLLLRFWGVKIKLLACTDVRHNELKS